MKTVSAPWPVATRRRAIRAVLFAPLLIALTPSRSAAQACHSADNLSPSEEALRKSVAYQDVYPDAAKRCEACAFFKPTGAGCGACQILNGSVAATGHCHSWTGEA
jgi:hypothetical protein